MREAEPLDPEIAAALEAIDATLDGEPVDPDLAELAELSLILRDGAPEPDPAFLGRLDARVRARFAAPERARSSRRGVRAGLTKSRRGVWGGVTVLVVAMVAALAVVIVPRGSHVIVPAGRHVIVPDAPRTSSSSSSSSSGSVGSSAGAGAGAAAGAVSGSAGGVTATTAPVPATPAAHGGVKSPAPVPSLPSVPGRRAPRPPSVPGRQIAQSAHLDLQARAGRIDTVAQGVFDVVGAEHGSVTSSHVSSEARGPSDASFQLRVPSSRLQAALDRLSHLSHARVISREDASQDITAQIGGAGTRLADARALRRSLLHQLAGADTTHDIDHLQTELRRNQSVIARDELSLARLHRRASDSTIAVNVTAPALTPRHRHHSGSGFTIHRALHDAGHVLLVAAGVLLIAVAVIIPLALVIALIAWVWTFVLRRRREGVLEG